MQSSCLVCGKPATDTAHWPRTKATGGTATVPLCRKCHTEQHWARPETIKALIAKAPGYWKGQGTWEQNREQLYNWLAKREYFQTVRGAG